MYHTEPWLDFPFDGKSTSDLIIALKKLLTLVRDRTQLPTLREVFLPLEIPTPANNDVSDPQSNPDVG